MPLVRISLVKGKPEAYRRKVGDAIHRALVETIGVPPLDRFQRIAANLGAAVGLRPQDAWINLVEVAKENWSFGNGEASYAPKEAFRAADRQAVVE
jgi:phenylpyruvate tautomerase PptA (4-oxalocrotonate tautomerase family)